MNDETPVKIFEEGDIPTFEYVSNEQTDLERLKRRLIRSEREEKKSKSKTVANRRLKLTRKKDDQKKGYRCPQINLEITLDSVCILFISFPCPVLT